MYFLSTNEDGLRIKNHDGKLVAMGFYVHQDEVRTMVRHCNSIPDVRTFCEQVIFWHENFAKEESSDIQKTTSKILLKIAKDTLERL
jgi:hypothetical protein